MGGGSSNEPIVFTYPSKPKTGDRVTFVARAGDPGRTVRMEIWVDRRRVSARNDDVCKYLGGPYPARTVLYAAVAIDKAGNRTTTPYKRVTIQAADRTPPVLRVWHKPESPRAGQKVTVFAQARDKNGVGKIEIKVGGRRKVFGGEKGSLTSGPYPKGVVNYEVTAFDGAGNRAWSGRKHFVVTAPPSTGASTLTGKIMGQRKFVRQVGASNLDRPSSPRTARVDGSGNYSIRNLPDGRYRVTPLPGGKFDVNSEPKSRNVTCKGRQTHTVNFKIKGIFEG
jgi:hypothetical protein